MTVQFSSIFLKDLRKIPEKIRRKLGLVVKEIQEASSLREIKNCKKLTGSTNNYRIRLNEYRAIFILIQTGNIVFFQRIMSRGQIYKKGIS